MAITTIPWNDGSGDNIYVSAPSQTGTQTVSVSSDSNTGAARSQTVTFTAGLITQTLTVNQEAGAPQQYTVTFNPSSYDTSDYSYASITRPERAYTDESSTTYCQINLTTGTQAETYVYFSFDTSTIPANATIDSVSCIAKTYISQSNVNNVQIRQWQLFTGTTPKGSSADINTGSAGTSTLSGASWTASELSNIRLRVYVKRGVNNVSSNYYIRLYGATLTVTYTV